MTDESLNRKLAEALSWSIHVPRYDTEPNAVFNEYGLIARMRERGFYFAVMELPCCDPPRFSACFQQHGSNEEWIDYGTNPMEAIARAALEALTQGVNNPAEETE